MRRGLVIAAFGAAAVVVLGAGLLLANTVEPPPKPLPMADPVDPVPSRVEAQSWSGRMASTAWIDETAASTDLPARVVQAYADAVVQQQEIDPACNLGWSTLAGIGFVES